MTPASPKGLLRTKRSALRFTSAIALGLITVIPSSGAASAAAVVTPFSFSVTETFADAPPECMPVVKSGVTRATDTVSGQITETDNGVSIHAAGTFTYRTDFPDGSYLSGTARDHFSLSDHGSQTVITEVVLEPRTIYSADGTAIGTVLVHALTHSVTDDLTGITTASIDRFFFTCS